MLEQPSVNERAPIRIGAVAYLNARPLTFSLKRHVPDAQITVDLPSRLADGLAQGRLDVALIPSIEYARNPGYVIVSDACVACDGPVRSVKLYSRVPVERIRTLALDEGSRTSAAMAQIILAEQYGLRPKIESLPIGATLADSRADAAVLIGDRGMRPNGGAYEFLWDLGRQWSQWTGLPFVFAMWVARVGGELGGGEQGNLAEALAAARDEGVGRLAEIARLEAPALNLPETECLGYLRDHLNFHLGPRQRQGLGRFYELAGRLALAPAGVDLVFYDQSAAR